MNMRTLFWLVVAAAAAAIMGWRGLAPLRGDESRLQAAESELASAEELAAEPIVHSPEEVQEILARYGDVIQWKGNPLAPDSAQEDALVMCPELKQLTADFAAPAEIVYIECSISASEPSEIDSAVRVNRTKLNAHFSAMGAAERVTLGFADHLPTLLVHVTAQPAASANDFISQDIIEGQLSVTAETVGLSLLYHTAAEPSPDDLANAEQRAELRAVLIESGELAHRLLETGGTPDDQPTATPPAEPVDVNDGS